MGGQPGQVRISVADLEVRRGTPPQVSGEIWFTLGETDFPVAHWTDSPLSVLGSLGEAIRSSSAGETGEAYFFDGPYNVRLIPAPAGTQGHVDVIGISEREGLISGTGEGVVEARCTVPLDELRRHYVSVLAEWERWARRHGHSDVAETLSRMARPGGPAVP
ncbi:hypothetical protein ACFYV5_11290 [Streptomyces sp. NPDC003035]|uniref:hypothetical protein n=1 Tax=Streptomyces sp. NPDC003035 TaxID=3364676 RepID=UPI003684CAC2